MPSLPCQNRQNSLWDTNSGFYYLLVLPIKNITVYSTSIDQQVYSFSLLFLFRDSFWTWLSCMIYILYVLLYVSYLFMFWCFSFFLFAFLSFGVLGCVHGRTCFSSAIFNIFYGICLCTSSNVIIYQYIKSLFTETFNSSLITKKVNVYHIPEVVFEINKKTSFYQKFLSQFIKILK